MEESRKKYADIIDLPHHQSDTRPKMSNYDRAAQFSPFAALTGHADSIKETARLTDEYSRVIQTLIRLKNSLISQGRYTDGVDDVLCKVLSAKKRKVKIKYI